MKIILFGANGMVGKNVALALKGAKHQVIEVGRSSGDYRVNIEEPESVAALYKQIETFDAVANASGEVVFAPLEALREKDFNKSFRSKLLGQINLVQQALPYIADRGSFTLVSGILGDAHLSGGVIAATVNTALAGYVRAAACELPRGLRINLVSPTVLSESMDVYGEFFAGHEAVTGARVGQTYIKSIHGVGTGQVLRVGYSI